MPHGLRRRIYAFSLSIALILSAAGGLLFLSSLRSSQRYQDILYQLTQIRQIRSDISQTSELVQNYVVANQENGEACYSKWTAVSYGINHLKSGDETAAMMAEDLQSYQAHTADTFDSLMQGRAAADISPLYQSFLEQQEERLFLCDLLANFLSDQMIQQYPSIMRDSHSYLALFLGILLCLLLLTAYFSYTFTRSVCHPVQKLVDQAGELMEGNYQTPDLKSAEQDEIGYLTHAFNEMKHQILENFQSKEQLWHVESLLKDAEYRALQSQINPHFLFNVLAVATEAALTENADRTMDIIERISYMLHYSLTSVRDGAPLADELKTVRAYIFLQEQRFGARIVFSLQEAEDLPEIKIPGMTLQPIVENAVVHGVADMLSGAEIHITASVCASGVELCVRDNGCGMSPELIDALNCGAYDSKGSQSTGLGVLNVRDRMELFYHRPGLFHIVSKKGEGTAVYLTYPIAPP
jgi:sensor histidine kinase YesM